MDLPYENWQLYTRGVVYKTNKEKGIECYIDAYFDCEWAQADADNEENVMSHTGYAITYAECPVLWCSKLQIEIALSTTEAEYISLSQAMREILPFMALMKEGYFIFNKNLPKPEVFCKVFKGNKIWIYVSESNKFSPGRKNRY